MLKKAVADFRVPLLNSLYHIGQAQTCAYPTFGMGIDNHVSGKNPPSLDTRGVVDTQLYLPCSPFKFIGAKWKGKQILCLAKIANKLSQNYKQTEF